MKNSLIVAAIPLLLGLPIADAMADRLPPGLEKKKERGRALPPGWVDRVKVGERLDDDIYISGEVVIPVGSNGEVTISVEGRLIRLIERTREVLELSELTN